MNDPHTISIDALLGHVYQAVTSPDGFNDFVAALIATFRLKAALMITSHVQTQEIKGLWMRGMPQQWMQSYAFEFGAEDMLAQHIRASPIALFYASNLDLDAEQFRVTRFYRDWVAPQGVAYASGAIVLCEGAWLTQLMLQRTPAQPPFARDELELLNMLMPHLQRALQMRQRFAELQLGQNFLTSGMDVLAMPTIMVDEFNRVAHCNQAADKLLDGRRDLWLEDRYVFSRNSATTQSLNFEIAKAIEASRGTGAAMPGVVLLPRVGRRDLMVLISPMHAPGGSRIHGGALLFAFDPETAPTMRAGLVQRLFSLSEAEAALAVALCNGLSLEQASNERGTSLNTVRSQLKSIFNKTGTNRQADLISVLLASPAYFLAHQTEA